MGGAERKRERKRKKERREGEEREREKEKGKKDWEGLTQGSCRLNNSLLNKPLALFAVLIPISCLPGFSCSNLNASRSALLIPTLCSGREVLLCPPSLCPQEATAAESGEVAGLEEVPGKPNLACSFPQSGRPPSLTPLCQQPARDISQRCLRGGWLLSSGPADARQPPPQFGAASKETSRILLGGINFGLAVCEADAPLGDGPACQSQGDKRIKAYRRHSHQGPTSLCPFRPPSASQVPGESKRWTAKPTTETLPWAKLLIQRFLKGGWMPALEGKKRGKEGGREEEKNVEEEVGRERERKEGRERGRMEGGREGGRKERREGGKMEEMEGGSEGRRKEEREAGRERRKQRREGRRKRREDVSFQHSQRILQPPHPKSCFFSREVRSRKQTPAPGAQNPLEDQPHFSSYQTFDQGAWQGSGWDSTTADATAPGSLQLQLWHQKQEPGTRKGERWGQDARCCKADAHAGSNAGESGCASPHPVEAEVGGQSWEKQRTAEQAALLLKKKKIRTSRGQLHLAGRETLQIMSMELMRDGGKRLRIIIEVVRANGRRLGEVFGLGTDLSRFVFLFWGEGFAEAQPLKVK
ncbi:Cyclic nucleotide-gated cation channel beta-1, partial [Ophiophagus hannah]